MIDASKAVDKQEYFYTVGGNVNQFNHCGRQYDDSSQIQNQKYHLTQQSHYWLYNKSNMNLCTIKTQAHACLLQHYLQQKSYETNPNGHKLQTGLKKCGIDTPWNTT